MFITFDTRALPTETVQPVWARPCLGSLASENGTRGHVPALDERLAR
jgi:hypothetical protein